MKHARHYAEHMMRGARSIPPTLFADTEDGLLMCVPSQMEDERAKNNFANTSRMIAVGYRATAVAMVLESWMTKAKPGESLDPSVPPSESPDREECVVITVENREDSQQQILLIQRDASGQFLGFGTAQKITEMKGRFAQMMPPKIPSEEDSKMARQLLKMMGVFPENRGFNPMWN